MCAVGGVEESRLAIQRELPSNGARDARNEIEFVIVPKRVGLHAREEMFLESRRQRVLGEQQEIRAIDVFNSRPCIVVARKTDGAFAKITIEDFAAGKILVTSPDE